MVFTKSNAIFVTAPLVLLLLFVPTEGKRVTASRPLGYSVFDDGICLNDVDCGPSEACPSPNPNGGICKKLRARSLGKRGAACSETTDCDQSIGLYCEEAFGPKPRSCQPKLPTGAACGGSFDLNECRGYCKRDNDGTQGYPGVCAIAIKIDSPCERNFECEDRFLPNGKADLGVCTSFIGYGPGVCVRQSQLITKLGAPCNRALDRCDKSRNLQCRWARSLRKTVCQQTNINEGSDCQRGNPLSRCARGLTCRPRSDDPLTGGPFLPDVLPTRCLPTLRFRQAGEPCPAEHDRCAGNTKCREIPGVDLFSPRLGPGPYNAAVYCVRTLKRWRQCSMKEKFLALCEDGFACKNGKCMRRAKGARTPDTHAYGGASCSKLPCSPGFKCGRNKACVRA